MKTPLNRRAGKAVRGAALSISIVTLMAAAQASPGAHGPNGEHLDSQAPVSASALARLPDGSIHVPKLAQRRMAIRTVMAAESNHALTLELNGRVAIDPNAGGRVQAPFAGRIEASPRGLPVAGQPVHKGQVLLRLHPVPGAIERANQQATLADLRASRDLAAHRVKRLEALEGTVPARELEAAKAALLSLAGREQAVAASLHGSDAILAPVAGVIASARVLAGQIVDARDILFEIVDPGQLLIEAASLDPTLAGRIGGASLPAAPGARLTVLGGARSLRDGALPILLRVQGKALPLAVGQPVTVLIESTDSVKGIALPAQALARNGANQSVVWIKSGAERFIALPVEAQPQGAGTIVVTRGLTPENRVVTSGAALLSQIR